ncbi:stage V sporulation T C-terminal domain-containing protein [Hespellia stercorisuis]|uniref:Transcriptional regulator, AbrB family n=1 Tax=Hespellia stercorisuis DSM 15480 TaxID=1121950 RepID=A0A1M6IJK8_9FIRM|nr:stage V sporulation T C-terminal domain-containing protein [Hespellia stercorisuis]SHJ34672.1 transcriptional regulator, AbrB family [Hespellia stercorisuis DSM 15480]
MKATGIVRRIDDLGRVVVPKEIRRTLRIREGDPLEIFTDREGEIILKKYSPVGEIGTIARQYADSLAQTLNCTVCIVDQDQVVAAAGYGREELQNKYLTRQMEEAVMDRKKIYSGSGEKEYLNIVEGMPEFGCEIIYPVVCEGDVIGALVLMQKKGKKEFTDWEEKVAQCSAIFLGKQMEQ